MGVTDGEVFPFFSTSFLVSCQSSPTFQMSANRAKECIIRTTQLPTTHIRDRMKLRAWQPTPVFLPGVSYGQRSLAGYGSWGAELDRTEVSEYACLKLRADPTAKELRINTEEAGGLE